MYDASNEWWHGEETLFEGRWYIRCLDLLLKSLRTTWMPVLERDREGERGLSEVDMVPWLRRSCAAETNDSRVRSLMNELTWEMTSQHPPKSVQIVERRFIIWSKVPDLFDSALDSVTDSALWNWACEIREREDYMCSEKKRINTNSAIWGKRTNNLTTESWFNLFMEEDRIIIGTLDEDSKGWLCSKDCGISPDYVSELFLVQQIVLDLTSN